MRPAGLQVAAVVAPVEVAAGVEVTAPEQLCAAAPARVVAPAPARLVAPAPL
jgi:hypothetical protein